MSCLYVFCHFGKRRPQASSMKSINPIFLGLIVGNKVTHRFLDIGKAVSGLAWYELPLDIQKNMPMIISTSQKPIFLRGFANTQCTLEVFMNVNLKENWSKNEQNIKFNRFHFRLWKLCHLTLWCCDNLHPKLIYFDPF